MSDQRSISSDEPSRLEAPLQQIFHHALELSADERERYLASACGARSELRHEVEALLSAHQEAEGGALLETQELDALGGSAAREAAERVAEEHRAATADEEQPGEWIDRYRLLEQIGEGGFGTVWMAEQREPVRRRVALKIVKLGMDTKRVVARFEQERQALALMEHPNIARVFDAGSTPEGRPYFVMELVRGIRITDYCDKARLSTTERIRLFLTVCDAVQHAHQKGIIHRDLKPSNVLVTLHDGVPVPKVIDFGVAKATGQDPLTELTLFTQFHEMIGTPLYMSPEQAEMSGLDVDTRSDIYSLGVLLYELLSGRTPIDPDSLAEAGEAEMRRIIREGDCPRPSTLLTTLGAEARTTAARNRDTKEDALLRSLRGDLDWIVMNALERDRNRRYESAHLLAADLQRHLASEPVLARPPSNWYRFQRLVRRNRVASVTTIAVTLILVAAGAVSLSQAARAEVETERVNHTLATLRATAPAFESQARNFFADGDFTGAMAQLDYAIKLRPDLPDYRLAKADLLMADFRFDEAAKAYRAALQTKPDNESAESSAALCEKLQHESEDGAELSKESITELHAFMSDEARSPIEMARIRKQLNKITPEILLEVADGRNDRFKKVGGAWRLNLYGLPVKDLSSLRGLQISDLSLNRSLVTDLSPLKELPLFFLNIYGAPVTDISPLKDTQIEELALSLDSVQEFSIFNEFPKLRSLVVYPFSADELLRKNILSLQNHPTLEQLTYYTDDKTRLAAPQSPGHFLAGCLVVQEQYPEAVTLLRERLENKQFSLSDLSWRALGTLLAAHGEKGSYDDFCREIISKYLDGSANHSLHVQVGLTCLLRPDAEITSLKLESLSLGPLPATQVPRLDIAFLARGFYQYRLGQYPEAIQDLSKVDDPSHEDSLAIATAVSAMAQFRQGNLDQALADSSRARSRIDKVWPNWMEVTWEWDQWMMADLVCREAEALLDGRKKDPLDQTPLNSKPAEK